MRTYLGCIPCIIRQALDATCFVTDDEAIQERVLREALRAASELDLRTTPAAVGQQIHRLIRQLTGNPDPYREVKEQFNRAALALYPEMKQRVESSPDPLETALRLAIAGNIIDFGVNAHLEESEVNATLRDALTTPIHGDVEAFRQAVAGAATILYLADNAGEIVFDRLLIEQMPRERVTVVVKGSPIINDATMADAQTAGLTDIVEVIDNGSDAPGNILETTSEEFRRRFAQADLVISKGQGNYETVSEEDKDVFFVLKAKCEVIARDLGCPLGSLVLQHHRPEKSTLA